MANEHGKDWRIRVRPVSSEANVPFTPIGGETSHSFRRTSSESDTSDKDSGIYGSAMYGLQRISVSLSGNLKLPDPGFAALHTASKSPTPEIEVQIAKGNIIKYQCVSSIGNFSHEAPNTGPVTFSCDLANAAAPTVDNLVATEPTNP